MELNYVKLTAQSMVGEIMALVLDELKAAGVWQKLSEAKQEETLQRIGERTKHLVATVVNLIASQGFARIPAILESVAAKKGLKAVIVPEPSQLELKHQLIDSVGQTVTIVLTNLDQIVDAPHGHQAEPNQRGIHLTY